MLNILIVDDDHNLAMTLSDSLRKELGQTIHVDTCFNGSDALTICAKTRFDLIVSDFNMPEMNGLELFRQVRVIDRHPALVLITAYGSGELEKQASQLVDAYIAKPFEISVLAQFIRQLFPSRRIEKINRVLILEDDPYLRRLISKVLRNGNLDVFEAATLEEARKFLDAVKFDVLIADIQVSDGQGTDLVREYRESLSQNGTIVILATGESRYRYLEEELGIDMYLEKPIAVQELVILVQRWTSEKEESRP